MSERIDFVWGEFGGWTTSTNNLRILDNLGCPPDFNPEEDEETGNIIVGGFNNCDRHGGLLEVISEATAAGYTVTFNSHKKEK